VLEVKGEHMFGSQNVINKKGAADLLDVASGMQYEIIAGQQSVDGTYGKEFLG